ncbi:uncharacterized protein LOC111863484 isoform X2 [Cryptotermes secundus]|uniref:uncharacterized protein LOC111863484 isoform X2 n=1 Tax=Cryptotermes secundus TaxID=105785 RepID=UPI001454BC1C|nr:uncharacterized protein LOC111863484 isoform X2 [Cryptotermes secundus]
MLQMHGAIFPCPLHLHDWSYSGTPVLGKPPKKSRESLGDAAHILKTSESVATTSSSHTPIANATTTTLSSCGADGRSTDKSETVKADDILKTLLSANEAPASTALTTFPKHGPPSGSSGSKWSHSNYK